MRDKNVIQVTWAGSSIPGAVSKIFQCCHIAIHPGDHSTYPNHSKICTRLKKPEEKECGGPHFYRTMARFKKKSGVARRIP